MRIRQKIVAVMLSAVLVSCASVDGPKTSVDKLSNANASVFCENDVAEIRASHNTARLNGCDVTGSNSFAFTITPEAKTDPQGAAINNSAWYGFRVDPKKAGDLRVSLTYENGKHRYRPKKSYDGRNWTVIPKSRLNLIRDNKLDVLLKTDERPFFISAQEIFTAKAHDVWTDKMATLSFVSKSTIGKSRAGHPLRMLTVQTEPSKAKPYVVWVGRQHPPEVTGALALIPFSETVLGDSELALRFRERFNVLIVPMMNPDGVKAGNWRFGGGGMDFNRDWGPFSQPETRAVRDAFGRFKRADGGGGRDRVAFFLDFHSTRRNLFNYL